MSDLNKKPAQPEKKPVKIVETVLRDAHQSLIATRMTTTPACASCTRIRG